MEAFSRLPGRLESGPVKCETRGEAAKPGLERCLLQHPNILLLPHLVSCATEERGRDGGFDLEHKSRALSQDVTSHAATSTPCNLLEKQKLPIKKGKQKKIQGQHKSLHHYRLWITAEGYVYHKERILKWSQHPTLDSLWQALLQFSLPTKHRDHYIQQKHSKHHVQDTTFRIRPISTAEGFKPAMEPSGGPTRI